MQRYILGANFFARCHLFGGVLRQFVCIQQDAR